MANLRQTVSDGFPVRPSGPGSAVQLSKLDPPSGVSVVVATSGSSSLASGTTYYYGLSAVTPDGTETPLGSAASGTTAASGTIYPNDVSWTNPVGIWSQVVLYRKTGSSGTWGFLWSTVSGTTYTDDGSVTPNTSIQAPSDNDTGFAEATYYTALGHSGASGSARFIGALDGAPTSGTFNVDDFGVDAINNTMWICTTAGTPGTWVKASPSPATTSAAGIVEVVAPPVSGTITVPAMQAAPGEVELTTTSGTTIYSVTPPNTGMFMNVLYARVVTATTTVSATITYTSNGGAQTYDIWSNQSLSVGDHAAIPFTFQNVGGDTVALSCTAGTANQVYIDARLVAL